MVGKKYVNREEREKALINPEKLQSVSNYNHFYLCQLSNSNQWGFKVLLEWKGRCWVSKWI